MNIRRCSDFFGSITKQLADCCIYLIIYAWTLGGALFADSPPNVFSPPSSLFENTDWSTGMTQVINADVDFDGDEDIVANWESDNLIVWYENNLNGEGELFTGPYPIYRSTEKLIIRDLVDLDLDGDLDILTDLVLIENRLKELEGDFKPWEVNDVYSTIIVVKTARLFNVDLDRDGLEDLVTFSTIVVPTSQITTYSWKWIQNQSTNGKLSLSEPIPVIGFLKPEGQDPFSCYTLSDLNQDGFKEFIGHYDDNRLIVQSTVPNTIPSEFDIENIYPVFTEIDYDQDGDNDLVTIVRSRDWKSFDITLLENTSTLDDTFEFERRILHTIYQSPLKLLAEDIDGDGDSDLMILKRGNADQIVSLENENGSFTPSEVFEQPVNSMIDMAVADLDGDGLKEQLSCSYVYASLYWHPINLDDENQENWGSYQLTPGLRDRWVVDIQDLNNDSKQDMIIRSQLSGHVAFIDDILREGKRDFSELVAMGNESLELTNSILSDLDNDGNVELIGASRSRNELTWVSNTSTTESINFNPAMRERLKFPDISGFETTHHTREYLPNIAGKETNYDAKRFLLTSDFDNDGDQDIVANSMEELSLHLWRNDLNTSGVVFAESELIDINHPSSIEFIASDIDNDGLVDLAGVSKQGNVYYYKNLTRNHIQNWSKLIQLNLDTEIHDIYTFLDFDGDGIMDFVRGESPELVLNQSIDGRLILSDPIDIDGTIGPGYKFAGDFDGDGDGDLVVERIESQFGRKEYRYDYFENTSSLDIYQMKMRDIFVKTPENKTLFHAFKDLDNDGDLDYFESSLAYGKAQRISWQKNIKSSFRFLEDLQNWKAFTNFGNLASVICEQGDQRVCLISPGIVPAYGFWGSPSVVPEEGNNPTSIVRSTWRVNSSTLDPLNLPTLRLRTSRTDYSRTDMKVITSVDNGRLSPKAGIRDYIQLISPGDNSHSYFFNFEMLHTDPSDRADLRMSLDSITSDYMPDANIGTERLIYNVDFTKSGSDPQGWYVNTIAHDFMYEPESIYAENGLVIRGVEPDTRVKDAIIPSRFGTWTKDTGLALKGNTIYRIRWTIASDAEQTERIRVPSFRFRANESTFRLARVLRIDSTGNLSEIPSTGEDKTHDQWILVPEEIDDSELILSFDYLYINNLRVPDDDPMIALTLKGVEIHEFMSE